jgi:3-methyladenine DNA glycosylase/8-oxoguanine DNA glycosylase
MTAIEVKITEALQELSSRNSILASLIEKHGPYQPRPSENPDIFASLARAIIYQQLAGKAAASIHLRFRELFSGSVHPAELLGLDIDTIRSAGLSKAKAMAVIDLAKHVEDGQLRLSEVQDLSDEDLVTSLVRVRGIGPWTAHMFMMFQLGRLNVWPTGDLGVRNGFGIAFCGGETPTVKELATLGKQFEPYRSIVAWYCWKAVDSAKEKKAT